MAGEQGTATGMAPASIANFGPGFDVFSLALDAPWDMVTISPSERPRVTLEGVGAEGIPTDPSNNAATVVVEHLRRRYQLPLSFSVHIKKGVPPGKGLGSSGASSVAAALAFAQYVRDRITIPPLVLLRAAAEGERSVAGYHFDNIAASTFGGFIVFRSLDPIVLTRVKVPPNLHIAIAIPEVVLETKKMRSILPNEVPMASAVANLGEAASLALGMARGDVRAIGAALEDRLVVPYRSRFIPGYDAARQAALEAGGYGFSICGSGAAVFSVCDTEGAAERVSEAVVSAFKEVKIEAKPLVARGNNAIPGRLSLPRAGQTLLLSEEGRPKAGTGT